MWKEHFTACSYNTYCMCFTTRSRSRGLLGNIHTVCFIFHSAVLFEYIVLLLITVKREYKLHL